MDYTTEIDIALLAVRLTVGLSLVQHGYGKFFKGGRIDGTAGWFESIGLKPGRLHAIMAASNEILIGLLFAAGLLTSFGAMGYVTLMVVAYWTVHRTNGFAILGEGWEYVFVLGVVAYAVATIGPGAFSIDEVLGIADDLDGWTGSVLSLLGVVLAGGFLAVFYRPGGTENADSA